MEDGTSDKIIINVVNVSNLCQAMTEQYLFVEDKLVAVEYRVAVNDAEKIMICNSLYEQAKAQLTTPTGNTLEDIKDGKHEVFWLDQEENRITLSFPKTAEGEPNAIFLKINVSRTNK